jgi:hypothetical protein
VVKLYSTTLFWNFILNCLLKLMFGWSVSVGMNLLSLKRHQRSCVCCVNWTSLAQLQFSAKIWSSNSYLIKSNFSHCKDNATQRPNQEQVWWGIPACCLKSWWGTYQKLKNCKCSACAELVIAASSWLRYHWFNCKKQPRGVLGQLDAEFQSSWKAANPSH